MTTNKCIFCTAQAEKDSTFCRPHNTTLNTYQSLWLMCITCGGRSKISAEYIRKHRDLPLCSNCQVPSPRNIKEREEA